MNNQTKKLRRVYRKTKTYAAYFSEYFKHRDVTSIVASINYVMHKKSHATDRLVNSGMGKFYCRANTTDFQFANYAYERHVKEYINRYKHNYNVFLDIGACIGDYSVWLAGEGFRCAAFEPVQENLAVLNINKILNDPDDKIAIYPYGLGRKNEWVNFNVREGDKGASRVIRDDKNSQGDIEIRKWDDFYDVLNIQPTDRIIAKLDVEGMEPETIEGGLNFIRACPDVLLILEAKLSGAQEIMKQLNSIGNFRYETVDEHNIAARKV